MDLSQVKRDILEALLLHQKPVKAAQVAEETKKERPAVQMHLIGLTKAGYATSPVKGLYLISEAGKIVLGVNEINKDKASAILASRSVEKAFHFYGGIGKPLSIYAHNLPEFCDKITKVSLESLEFHLSREDFEAWFRSLGDLELAKKVALLKESNVKEAELKVKLLEVVDNRCKDLSRIANHSGS